jgi:hypothetical protein
MRMLSIPGNDFVTHRAYEETISLQTEPNEFSRMLSQRGKNVNSFYMYIHAEHTGSDFIVP